MKIKCTLCGKAVSTEVPEGTIVRAYVECPECIMRNMERTVKEQEEEEKMITYKNVQYTQKRKEFSKIKCDKCGKYSSDPIDVQNWMMYSRNEGYGSIYGDGNGITCDLCPECMNEIMGLYIRIIEE